MSSSEDALFQRFGKDFPRGAVLFREGDPGGEMYVVQRGHVRITKRASDVEKVLSTLGAGEFLGEMSILSGKPRTATATCAEDCRLLVVDGRTFESMLRANSEIALRMIRKLAERLAQADEQIESLMLPDATARVVHHLLGVAEKVVAATAAGPVRIPVPVADLAARIGITPAQVDEAMAKLARARVAGLQDGYVVADVARLGHYLEYLRMRSQFGEGP